MADPVNFYQAVGFHFSVHFSGIDGKSVDVRFQSVTGLDGTVDTEQVKEGGENRFEHVIPTRRKFGPLVLKRGVLGPEKSAVSGWMKKIFEEEPFSSSSVDEKTQANIERLVFKVFPTVEIFLLGEGKEDNILMSWQTTNVWPRSWKIGELNAERGEVLIETLELNYSRLIMKAHAPFNPIK
jgi:phage tail-like protein